MEAHVETTVETLPPDGSAPIVDATWRDAKYLILSGLCMGTADLVPGVSGGTMAVALGIYRRLLAAIDSVADAVRVFAIAKTRRLPRAVAVMHWKFIALLGFGIALALVLMGKVVGLPRMVTENPKPVYSVFFGLVVASTWLLGRRVRAWSASTLFALALGTALGYLVVQLVPMQTPTSAPFIFMYGAIAITAMILPGISGSFMLLVMGQYEHIITSVLAADLAVIAPFALGCGTGLLAFSRLLGYLLDRYHNAMTAGLTGLLLGTLVRIWPYQTLTTEIIREKPRVVSAVAYWPTSLEGSVLALAVLGLVMVLGVEWLATRRQAAFES